MPTMVPDRGDDPKRKVIWDVHNVNTGDYMHSFRGGQTVPKRAKGMNLEVSREGYSSYKVPPKRNFK